MRRRMYHRARPLLLGLVLTALSACSLPFAEPALPRATPTNPRPADGLPAGRASTPSTDTKRPLPLPSATPYATPRPEPGRFERAELGLALSYPSGWRSDPGEDENTLVWLYPASGEIYTVLFVGQLANGVTLQAAAADVRASTQGGLSEIVDVDEHASRLDDGRPAWSSEYHATRDDGSPVQVLLTTTASGSRLFTLMAFGDPDRLDLRRAAVEQIARGITLSTPLRYGIPEDQALLEAGGESSNPRSYDPAHAGGSSYVFSGLVMLTPELQVAPDLAESWSVSPDGRVYIFRLRANARFHNGRPVTADDVVYSWERAADPATASDYVLTYLGDIVGLAERHTGTADHIAGLRAVDPHTIEVTLDAPKPYFVLKLSYRVTFIVDHDNIETGPEWYRAPNGTGPYRLARWEAGVVRIYERNPDFYLSPPAIPYIIEQIYAGSNLRLYETGDLDYTSIGGFNLERARDPEGPWPGQLREIVNLCTSYVGIDPSQPPFDDVLVRQAFALAVDREQIATLMQESLIPADGLYPPALPGYSADLDGQRFDPSAARDLLARSRYADAMPPVIYTTSGYGGDLSGMEAALAGMWERHLGVRVTFENLEPERWSEVMHSGRHGQLYGYAWCADYPDPENFADALFHSGAQQNLGGYTNPELDILLERARVERDVTRRIEFYQQAEQLLVDDAAAIFLGHSRSFLLVKPRIKGYVLTPLATPIERYLTIESPLSR